VRLVKFIEGKNTKEELTLEEAEYYHGILNQRLSRTTHLEKTKAEHLA